MDRIGALFGRAARSGRVLAVALAGVCLFGPVRPTVAEDRVAEDGAAEDRAAEQPAAEYSHGVLIRFEGQITPQLQQYLYRQLDRAQAEGADLVIVEIESPGGYLQESEEIALRLSDLEAHTVAYIPSMALSGAAIVALGCDEILMDPDARMGDAGPIYLGEGGLFEHVPQKFRTDLKAFMRVLAEKKHRPPGLAEAMVDMDLQVYHVRHRETGQQKFMSEQEWAVVEDSGDWEKGEPVPETIGDDFLEVTGRRAVELQLAEGHAESREELERRYGLKDGLRIFRHTGVDTAVTILNSSLVTGVLFVIGLVGLYIEFSSPGIGVGGLIAVLCFGIFFWSRFLGGTAEWLEVVLFVSGILFLGVELFVLPGFGIAGIGGALLLLASLVMANLTYSGIPKTTRQLTELTDTMLLIFISGGVFVGVAVVLSRHFGSLPLLSRIALQPPGPVGNKGTGPSGQAAAARATLRLGDCGVASTPLRPAGKARFGNHYIDVVTDASFITKGSPVKIIEIGGNRVVVGEMDDAG